MSDQKEDGTTTEKKAIKKKANWLNVGIYFSTFAIILLIVLSYYSYFFLANTTKTLSERLSRLEINLTSDNKNIEQLQNLVSILQQASEKSQALSEKQEKLIADWQSAQQGNLDQWYVAEAQYMVRLANTHADALSDPKTALVLLQQAAQMLQLAQDDRLSSLRQSIADDISKLNSQETIDTTSIYLQLNALNSTVDQLSFPVGSSEIKTPTIPSSDISESWWQKGLNHSWQMLKQLVVVRYNGSSTLPFMMPDEKLFLYQNLHAQLENAMLAVLNRNETIYQASLMRGITWIEKYFDQSAPLTQTMIQHLEKLHDSKISPPTVNFSETLQLFDQYFSTVKQVQQQ